MVSLEAVPSGYWGERDDGQQLSEWLYFAKTKPAMAAERISQVIVHDSGNRLYFASPFTNPADARDMGNEDARLMLKSLRDTKSFAWIIVDTEAGWCPRVLGALEASDLICWIVHDDWPCYQKTRFILEHWKQEGIEQILMPKTIFFNGKYLGETRCRYNDLGVTPNAALPYVPHWKSLQRPEETLKAAFYSQQLWHGVQTALKLHLRRPGQWSTPS